MPDSSSADTQFMRCALRLAEKARERGEVPVGAVVVAQGEVIGEGFNQPITLQDPSAHAEMLALRAAAKHIGNYRLQGASLYVTIEPCMMCCGAMVHARIARLVFAAREPRAGAVVSNAQLLENRWLNHRVQVVEGVLAEPCGELMRAFFRERRRERSS
ncbi:MAG: tRNA adenosine(34) deaminase TadA [Gammaproteobacteria bacterium]|nr:tRNA adenosine(34) deaminase TadA [Gammaproteobacteria bacterium]MCY4277598.1 tRNA adenosine(34) deaminase TadA [Gammaproteobacteria bacterium]